MMDETSFEKYISDSEIEQVSELIEKRQQRLYDVSETTNSHFHFCLPYAEHFVSVAVVVRPFNQESYPCFEITAQYRPCCTTLDQDSDADHHFKWMLQATYDTYIRPIRRRLDDGW